MLKESLPPKTKALNRSSKFRIAEKKQLIQIQTLVRKKTPHATVLNNISKKNS